MHGTRFTITLRVGVVTQITEVTFGLREELALLAIVAQKGNIVFTRSLFEGQHMVGSTLSADAVGVVDLTVGNGLGDLNAL